MYNTSILEIYWIIILSIRSIIEKNNPCKYWIIDNGKELKIKIYKILQGNG